jgi:hypothetical protein
MRFILAYSKLEERGRVHIHEEFIWELYLPIKEVDKKNLGTYALLSTRRKIMY